MKKNCLLFVSFFVVLVFWTSTAISALVYFQYEGEPVTEITVDPCQEFTLDLWIEDVPTEHEGLPTWLVDIEIDPLVEYVEHAPLTYPYSVTKIDPYSATEPAIAFSGWDISMEPPDGSFQLASITFHCLAPGITHIIPMEHFGSDAGDFVMGDNFLLDNELTFQGVKVTQTPIPTTLLLLGGGIIGVIGLRRKIQG